MRPANQDPFDYLSLQFMPPPIAGTRAGARATKKVAADRCGARPVSPFPITKVNHRRAGSTWFKLARTLSRVVFDTVFDRRTRFLQSFGT